MQRRKVKLVFTAGQTDYCLSSPRFSSANFVANASSSPVLFCVLPRTCVPPPSAPPSSPHHHSTATFRILNYRNLFVIYILANIGYRVAFCGSCCCCIGNELIGNLLATFGYFFFPSPHRSLPFVPPFSTISPLFFCCCYATTTGG